MPKKILFFSLFSVALCVAISIPVSKIPAMGPLLSPFSGIWASQPFNRPPNEEVVLPALAEPVKVLWDEYGIPHIFARTNKDLFTVQGYLAARDRLFQMDVQSRPGAGRIAELAGERARDMDRFFIKIGMRQASQRAVEFILQDAESREALEAYTEGVNTYIKSLKPKVYPPEYKILAAKPSLWSPLRTANFLKTMSFNLAGRSYDLHLTRHLQKLGREKTEFYFPNYHEPQYEELIFYPGDLKRSLGKALPVFTPYVSHIKEWPVYLQPFAANGSNNFAVNAKKSATGHSILANDTHLGLTLPSIWYELQLVSGQQNVYGASFPGAPGVVLGFNARAAWGVTNGTSDVIDWHEIEFRDENSEEYLLDGEWIRAEKITEILNVRRGSSENIDLLWTKLGVVLHREGKIGLAMSWTAHHESNELKALLELSRSSSVESCLQATTYFKAPAQNFLCADTDQVGLRHQGRFPKRIAGQGKYVMDGRSSATLWKEFIEEDLVPTVRSPGRNYLRSANDTVVNETYPSFLGWDYEEGYRAKRIREVIEGKTKISSQDLIDLQNDIYDSHAAEALPIMMKDLKTDSLTDSQKRLFDQMSRWDHLARGESVEPSFFFYWWTDFEKLLYGEILGPREGNVYPRRQRTVYLLRQGHFELGNKLNESFDSAWKSLSEKYGADFTKWTWGSIQPTQLKHMARIPGFGSDPKVMSGTRYSPNANKGDHGATWKLVVEMGPELRAWSSIPGHNDGHPFSASYERFIDPWTRGEMKSVHFLRAEDAAGSFETSEFVPRERESSPPL